MLQPPMKIRRDYNQHTRPGRHAARCEKSSLSRPTHKPGSWKRPWHQDRSGNLRSVQTGDTTLKLRKGKAMIIRIGHTTCLNKLILYVPLYDPGHEHFAMLGIPKESLEWHGGWKPCVLLGCVRGLSTQCLWQKQYQTGICCKVIE